MDAYLEGTFPAWSTTKLSNTPKDSDDIFFKRSTTLKLFKEIFPQDKKKKKIIPTTSIACIYIISPLKLTNLSDLFPLLSSAVCPNY